MPRFSSGVRFIERFISSCACVSLGLAMVHLTADAAPNVSSDDRVRAVQIAQATHYKVGDRVEVNPSGTHWVPATVTKVAEDAPYPYEVRVDGEAWTRVIWNEIIRRPTGGRQQAPQREDERPAGSANAAASQAVGAPMPAAAYHVGERVDALDGGRWFKAVVIAVRQGYAPYRVHPIGYISTMDHWVQPASIRPAGSGPSLPIPGGASGEANDEVLTAMRNPAARGTNGTAPASSAVGAAGGVVAKHYKCVYFVVDHLVDAAPFTIDGAGRYTDSNGARGTYDVRGSVLTFHGGNYNGQRAEVDTARGRPAIHILGPSGRRVIDCD